MMVVASGGDIPNRESDISELPVDNPASQFVRKFSHAIPVSSARDIEGGCLEEHENDAIYRGDGMEWLMGDYYVEDEVIDDMMYALPVPVWESSDEAAF